MALTYKRLVSGHKRKLTGVALQSGLLVCRIARHIDVTRQRDAHGVERAPVRFHVGGRPAGGEAKGGIE